MLLVSVTVVMSLWAARLAGNMYTYLRFLRYLRLIVWDKCGPPHARVALECLNSGRKEEPWVHSACKTEKMS